MIEQVFDSLEELYRPGAVAAPVSIYFAIGDLRRTVLLQPDACRVTAGKTGETADCVCKMGDELFLRVWNDGYRPGLKDFLGGAIKSNDPSILKLFLRAFGKEN
jgi:hypothetical protein